MGVVAGPAEGGCVVVLAWRLLTLRLMLLGLMLLGMVLLGSLRPILMAIRFRMVSRPRRKGRAFITIPLLILILIRRLLRLPLTQKVVFPVMHLSLQRRTHEVGEVHVVCPEEVVC